MAAEEYFVTTTQVTRRTYRVLAESNDEARAWAETGETMKLESTSFGLEEITEVFTVNEEAP